VICDEHGGDMNGDGMCDPNNASSTAVCPWAGGWRNIIFTATSQDSSLTHTIIRYGGRWFHGVPFPVAVAVVGTDVLFEHITVEHSMRHGLLLNNSSSTVINSVFRNNNTTHDAAGLSISGGAPTIVDSTFSDNKYGIFVSNSPSLTATANIFTGNSVEALHIGGAVGAFSSNTGSGNTTNAIVIGEGIITESGTTTLYANSLSYLVRRDARVVANSTLVFEKGGGSEGF